MRHVALVSGLKHDLEPFEAWGKVALPLTPFREAQGRLEVETFYDARKGRPIEGVADVGESRRMGFTAWPPADDAVFEPFARLRAGRLIP